MDETLKPKPLVSIMMTSYNCAGFICEAIESVLSQTYPHWELIILDDASSDNTADVVQNYTKIDSRIIYLPAQQNLGITKNRNRGFNIARGKYIAVLDSDDFWLNKDKLKKQVDFLEEKPEYSLLGTNTLVVNTTGEQMSEFKYEVEDNKIRQKILLRNQFTHSSLVWRRSTLREPRPYDESLFIWEDYDLALRLGLLGKMANLPEFMTAYRKHDSNISRKSKIKGGLTHLSIIKRYRNLYPNYLLAALKGWLRLLR